MSLVADRLILPDTPGWIRYFDHRLPGETPHPDDDFFKGPTMNSAWSAIAPVSGTATPTQGHGLMSLVIAGTSSANAAGLVKSIGGLTAPVTIESAVWGGWGVNIDMAGIWFTDGTSSSSNVAALWWSIPQATIRFETGTITSVGDPPAGVVSTISQMQFNQWLYMRVVWKSANTWALNYSLDGVSWTRQSFSATYSKTMTPTHFGLSGTTWNGGTPTMATYQYFRVYNADLSV